VAAALTFGALSLPTAPAGAAGADVDVVNMAFTPKTVTVTLGSKVTWRFKDVIAHTSTSDQGFWASPHKSAGQTFSHVFPSSGTYAYHCAIHPTMRGKVRVPMGASGSASAGWTIRWSTKAAPAGRNFDVQVRRSGSSIWRAFRTDTKHATGFFDPAGSGSWSLRARTGNTVAGKVSGWSPDRSVVIS
jgi:plastocyanin